MDAKAFFDKHGTERCQEVAIKSGTTLEYFRQIMCGHRRPSPWLAEQFVRNSGGEMDFVSLLRPSLRANQ